MRIEDFDKAKFEIKQLNSVPLAGVHRLVHILNFLVERIEALESPPQKCTKCGSFLQKQTDGDLGCQRCDVEEIFSQYKQDDHEDALSRIVSELEHTDVTMKRYDADKVLAQTASSETSQAKAKMQELLFGGTEPFKHPLEDAQTKLAMEGPPKVESIQGDPYVDITINGSRRKAPLGGVLTYETIIVSYDPTMAALSTNEWPRFSVEFKRDSGATGAVPFEQSLAVSPGMAITVNREPSPPKLHHFKLDKDDQHVINARMTGMTIKCLLKDDRRAYALYIEGKGNDPDKAVGDDEVVNVEGLRMYTVPSALFGTGQEEAKEEVNKLLGEAVEVIVNTDPETLYFKEGEPREITYEQIVRFACDQIDKARGRPVKPTDHDGFPMMSVTYRHKVPFEQLPGERDGSLWKGKKVAVTPGMIINAYCT